MIIGMFPKTLNPTPLNCHQVAEAKQARLSHQGSSSQHGASAQGELGSC